MSFTRREIREMKLAQELSQAWQNAVASGRIVNKFEASEGDPTGRWARGDRISFGLAGSGDDIKYEAWNVRTAEPIEAAVDERTIGDTGFVCQFNGYRALRPGGTPRTLGRQLDISPTPSECRFGCQTRMRDLSLLNRAPLLQVRLQTSSWNAYHNANPFEKDGHFLWLPVQGEGELPTIPHLPQMLTREFVEDLVLLSRQAPELVIFFNSLHAGASVNHVHAQAVFHRKRLAIEDAATVQYRGFTILDGYPAQGFCFSRDSEVSSVATAIEKLQTRGIPFNLILLGERMLLVPRNADHEIVVEFPRGILATMEVSGKIITADRQVYEQATAADISSAFQKVTLDAKSLIDAWESG